MKLVTVKAAFFAAYHCQWLKDERRWLFDPAMTPGDPESAWRAWLWQEHGIDADEWREWDGR